MPYVLASKVSEEKSFVILILDPLYVMIHFSYCFQDSLCEGLLVHLLWNLLSLDVCICFFYQIWGVSYIVSTNFLSTPFSLLLLQLSRNVFWPSYGAPLVPWASLLFFILFVCLFLRLNHLDSPVFKLNDSSSCSYLIFEFIYWIFHFRYYSFQL